VAGACGRHCALVRQLARQFAGRAGERPFGDRLGGQERAHIGQFGRGRVIAGQLVGGQLGGGGQRARVGHRLGLGQNLPGPGGQQLQVPPGGHTGPGQVSGRLGDGQRQVAQLPGELISVGLRQPADPRSQDRHRFSPGQHVDLDRDGNLGPAALPGGDQHMTTTTRQPADHIARVFGVVEHQQPPIPVPQLPQHRRPHR
jgi:hypothetical protein